MGNTPLTNAVLSVGQSFPSTLFRSVLHLDLWWWPMLGVLALFWYTGWRKASWSGGMNYFGEPVCFQSSAADDSFLSHCVARVAQLKSLTRSQRWQLHF